MNKLLTDVIDLDQHPLHDDSFRIRCKQTLDENVALVMPNFLKPAAIESVQQEGKENQHLAYYTANRHNVYLTESDPSYSPDHPRNRTVEPSKGCITTDQIPTESALFTIYNSLEFRDFLCAVLGETELQ